MRDHSGHIQAEREEALHIIVENTPVMQETESVPVELAVGRVLAEDACSRWDSPNALTCELDSVAVHWDDFIQGIPDTSGWVRGRDWAFANTDYPALYSYCKYTNVGSYKTAESIGMHFEKEYPDPENKITHVSVIFREER